MKKTALIFVILILLGAGAWYYFSRSGSPSQAGQTISNTSPFGTGEGSVSGNNSSQGNTGSTSPANPNAPTAHLFKISDAPVAGGVAFINKAGALKVRYVERATGHIIEIDPVTLAKTEIVNSTIPKVYEALWKKDGSAVIIRTLGADGETILSNSISLAPPAGTSTSDIYATKSSNLVANIASLSGQNTIFYNVRKQPQIVSAAFDGSKATTIWSAPFTDWLVRAAGDTSALLVTKPSSNVVGYAYNLSAKGGTPQKILGPLDGLSVIESNDLARIAYSYITSGSIVLNVKNLSTGGTTDITPATFADKCAWGVSTKHSTLYCAVPSEQIGGNEPDAWYQGVSNYTDRIWSFDPESEAAAMRVDPKKDFGVAIDAQNLFLSPSEDYLFFQNKNDLSLWALKLD